MGVMVWIKIADQACTACGCYINDDGDVAAEPPTGERVFESHDEWLDEYNCHRPRMWPPLLARYFGITDPFIYPPPEGWPPRPTDKPAPQQAEPGAEG